MKEESNPFSKKAGYNTADPIIYPLIKNARQELKENPTPAERILWKYLRNNQIGHKIRRQHVIGKYIVDFVCLKKKLVIEVDGGIHKKQIKEDQQRTFNLNDKGYKVIRFANEEVCRNVQFVVTKIKEILDHDLQNSSTEEAK